MTKYLSLKAPQRVLCYLENAYRFKLQDHIENNLTSTTSLSYAMPEIFQE